MMEVDSRIIYFFKRWGVEWRFGRFTVYYFGICLYSFGEYICCRVLKLWGFRI